MVQVNTGMLKSTQLCVLYLEFIIAQHKLQRNKQLVQI